LARSQSGIRLGGVEQEGLRPQRVALMTLPNEGQLSEGVFEELVAEVDRQLE
jgi:hypothetical protein